MVCISICMSYLLFFLTVRKQLDTRVFHFVTSDWLLMSRDLKKIYDWCQEGECFIIPDYATEICDHCCYHNELVTDVMFGPFPSLERIGWESFAGVQLVSFGQTCNWLHNEH